MRATGKAAVTFWRSEAAKAALSRLHSKVRLAAGVKLSVPVKLKLGALPEGVPEVIEVSGGVVSIVQLKLAGEASILPA